MFVTTGHTRTPNASKYLQQLCKHFGHKVDVTYDALNGRADLPVGAAIMTADDTSLTIRIESKDAEAAEVAQHVIDSHLERFAFRENITSLAWTSS